MTGLGPLRLGFPLLASAMWTGGKRLETQRYSTTKAPRQTSREFPVLSWLLARAPPRGDVRLMAFAFTTPSNNSAPQDTVKGRKTGRFWPGLGSMRAHVVLYRMCHLFSTGTGWGEESIYVSPDQVPGPSLFHPLTEQDNVLGG